MTRVLIPLLSAAILLAGGLVHGFLSDRWSPLGDDLVQEARGKLDEFPYHVGDWDGVQRHWNAFDQSTTENDFITRAYINRRDGTSVGMLIAAGHARNLRQWHTPLQCYPAKGYDQACPVTKSVVDVDGSEAEFRHTDFTLPRASAPDHVRVFWAFSGDGRWLAPDDNLSQLTFGRYRSLYKVYVLRQLHQPGETLDDDVCLRFLKVAIPKLNSTFFPQS
jgi:hypothetical protein